MKKRKILIILSTIILSLVVYPHLSMANKGIPTEGSNLSWTREDFEYETVEDGIKIKKINISGEDKIVENEGIITIPSQIDGKNVTILGEGLFKSSKIIKNINFPENLIEIEKDAFALSSLEGKISLPKSIEIIGDYAFDGGYDSNVSLANNKVNEITEIEMGENIKNIGVAAFRSCGLKGFKWPKDISKVSNFAFQNCKNLTSIDLPEGIIEIGNGSFTDTDLEGEVKLPKTLKKIGSFAFSVTLKQDGRGSNSKISEINLPENLEEIGKGAFIGCGMSKVKIPKKISRIEDQVFSSTEKLELVEFHDDIVYIGKKAFWLSGINRSQEGEDVLILPKGLKEQGFIAEESFRMCGNIKKLKLPSGIKEIKERSFSANDGLKEIIFNSDLVTIGESSFSYTSKLESVTFPNSLERIGRQAFFQGGRQDGLKELFIPKNVETISPLAFHGNRKLKELTIEEGSKLKKIESSTFGSCGLESLYLPEGIEEIAGFAFDGNELGTKIIDHPDYKDKPIADIRLPNSLKTVETGAFQISKELNAYFPEGRGNKNGQLLLRTIFIPEGTKVIASGVEIEKNIGILKNIKVGEDVNEVLNQFIKDLGKDYSPLVIKDKIPEIEVKELQINKVKLLNKDDKLIKVGEIVGKEIKLVFPKVQDSGLLEDYKLKIAYTDGANLFYKIGSEEENPIENGQFNIPIKLGESLQIILREDDKSVTYNLTIEEEKEIQISKGEISKAVLMKDEVDFLQGKIDQAKGTVVFTPAFDTSQEDLDKINSGTSSLRIDYTKGASLYQEIEGMEDEVTIQPFKSTIKVGESRNMILKWKDENGGDKQKKYTFTIETPKRDGAWIDSFTLRGVKASVNANPEKREIRFIFPNVEKTRTYDVVQSNGKTVKKEVPGPLKDVRPNQVLFEPYVSTTTVEGYKRLHDFSDPSSPVKFNINPFQGQAIPYNVKVLFDDNLVGDKSKITSFKIGSYEAKINDEKKEIVLQLPKDVSHSSLVGLIPSIKHTAKAIDPDPYKESDTRQVLEENGLKRTYINSRDDYLTDYVLVDEDGKVTIYKVRIEGGQVEEDLKPPVKPGEEDKGKDKDKDKDRDKEEDKQLKISEFSVGASKGEIDNNNGRIVLTLPYEMDITRARPFIQVSPGASINPPSGKILDLRQNHLFTLVREDEVKTYLLVVKIAPPKPATKMWRYLDDYIKTPKYQRVE